MSELDKKMRNSEDTMDDYTIHVEIIESVGDGGTFYGDHIVVGHPFEDPPSNWEHGQLLFDGNEEGGIWEGEDGSGGAHFSGDHVLTGDPNNPPENLIPAQLLWDGNSSVDGSGDVLTALLAKVEEQSEQIAILSADIQELKGA
jgi:hypothetical protein